MFRNIVIRLIKISTRTLLYSVAVFYLAVIAWELHLVSNLTYSFELKLSPKVFNGTMINCQTNTSYRHLISTQKIPI